MSTTDQEHRVIRNLATTTPGCAGQEKKLKIAVVILASCFPFAASAAADTISVTLDPNYPSDYTFYSFTATDGSTYTEPVAPYYVSLNDSDGLYVDASAYAICYDINNSDYVGQTYSGTLAFNTDTATMEATYLTNQLVIAGLNSASPALKGEISMAIWQIMFPSSTQADGSVMPVDPLAESWETAASQVVSSGEWTVADSDLYPTFIPSDTSSQRYALILDDAPQAAESAQAGTPEPGTVGLLIAGGGLLLAGCKFRRTAVAV